MQTIICLTGLEDHIHVITPIRRQDGTFPDPTRPAPADGAAGAHDKKKADE